MNELSDNHSTIGSSAYMSVICNHWYKDLFALNGKINAVLTPLVYNCAMDERQKDV